MMTVPHAFVFIRYSDQESLAQIVRDINANRLQRFFYRSLILTEPRRGWIALLIGGGMTDHLLLRNLSGQLNTIGFELEASLLSFAYRLHQNGRTVSAFESHLPFYVNNRLSLLQMSNDPAILDLAEPVERFVLRRFHARHNPGGLDSGPLVLPDDLQTFYAGNAASLWPLLRADADETYIASLLAPGFNPQTAFERLADALNLPYLPNDFVNVIFDEGEAQRVNGYAITDPGTWRDELPSGWQWIAVAQPKAT